MTRQHGAIATLIAVIIAIALAAFGVVRGTWAVGGSDSSCYALMAKAFAEGELQPASALAADAPWPDASLTFAPGGFIAVPGQDQCGVADLRPGHVGVDGAARRGVRAGRDLLADADRCGSPGPVRLCDRPAARWRSGRRHGGDPHRDQSDRALSIGAADERHRDGGVVDRRHCARPQERARRRDDRRRDPRPPESRAACGGAGAGPVHPVRHQSASRTRAAADDRGFAAGRARAAVVESRFVRQRDRLRLRRHSRSVQRHATSTTT